MKISKNLWIVPAMACAFFFSLACSSDDANDDNSDSGDTPESCYIHLFDDDDFGDDNIIVEGEGDYADLSDLPNSDGEDWTDEADSFKVGPETIVTVWTETNFEGDSTVYETGDYPSVDEPYSMKIRCEEE